MKKANPRLLRLKDLFALEEKRAELQQKLDHVHEKIIALKDELFATLEIPARPSSRGTAGSKNGTRKRAPRGSMKEFILSAMEAAGTAGVRVKELAETLGTRPVNVHSWFHSTAKRNPAIIKISGGHYRLENGHSAGSDRVLGSNKTAARSKASPTAKTSPTKSATGKTGSAKAKASPLKSGSRRGRLSEKILSALEQAGSAGVTIKDLANRLNLNYRNISIWFATTGKKFSRLKKLGPAHYALTK